MSPSAAVAGTQARLASPRAAAPRIVFRPHPRARRYTLRLNREGDLLVTIPRGGSQRAALGFVERSRDWIDRQQERRAGATGHEPVWTNGTRVLWRGESALLMTGRSHGRPFVAFGDQRIWLADVAVNLRRPVELRLRARARAELPPRTQELARILGITIHSVAIRDQSSRWGSCSERGVISLNWRLVQAPAFVGDYLIVHELMHRREMNHSIRFWRHVATAFPRWREAEAWLDAHAVELGF